MAKRAMEIRRIGVVGAGTMGSGIAQVAAQAGFETAMYDAVPAALGRATETIRRSLGLFVENGKLAPAERDAVLARIHAVTDLPDAAREADLVIEAVPEDLSLKKRVFAELDRLAPPGAILATNTSSLSIDEIASATRRPDKVIGLHFSNPVPVMKVVEIIRGLLTSEETLAASLGLAARLGKEPVMARDFPGFIGNRLLPLFLNEAFQVLMEGIGTAEDIDKMVRLALRHPMGPLELADFIGLDTLLSILEYLHQEIGERYRPCPLLRQMVRANRLGRKTGQGVYTYRQT
jgi:3-hydroxybutyryl-CoA dehydrogenase